MHELRLKLLPLARLSLVASTLTLFLSLSASSQQTGPLPPVSGSSSVPVAAPSQPAARPAEARQGDGASSAISDQPPAMPVEQIVQRFAEREAEFRKERDNYTYTQTFIVQSLDIDGNANGEFRQTSDILFTPAGKRYEKVTFAPPGTLKGFDLDQQDMEDLEHVQPFVLTTEELPKYDIKYVGRQQVDELHTYVFDVAPKKIEKNQRYFQGRIWVDDKDLNIVKTDGKAVPDIRKKGSEHLYPRFETFRENIEGHYWFPTYTRANDVLQFSTGPVGIRMVVRYENYKRFGVTIKLGQATEVKPPQR